MKIRILSDLHAEFTNGNYDLPVMDDEKNTVLCYAGDLGVADRPATYVDLIGEWCERFRAVLYVNGNHEFYKSSLWRATDKIRGNIEFELGGLPTNLHYNDRFTAVIGDTAFICATLWTDMDNGNPVCMGNSELMMNDYRVIRNGPSKMDPYKWKLRAVHTMGVFQKDKKYIFDQLAHYQKMGFKTVVMTHHAPSTQSIAAAYVDSDVNGAYASELYDAYDDDQPMPIIHIHGHVHNSFDYYLGDTRVICNPRGYVGMGPGDLNGAYQDEYMVKI